MSAVSVNGCITVLFLDSGLGLSLACFLTTLSTGPGKPGNSLPPAKVYIDTPFNSLDIREIFKDKKGVLFSVLGAYTPGCSQSHIPEYLENYDKFKAEGYDIIACLAVNDPYVMAAWGKDMEADGKILMLADTHAEFTKAMKMELDCRHIMGTYRSKRYSIVIHDNVIQGFNGEPDHSGLACLMCIKNLNKVQKHTLHTMDNVA